MFTEVNEPFLVKKFNLSEIDCWDEIDRYKKTYILNMNPERVWIRYPGFVFKNLEDKKTYEEFYVNNLSNVFTPPRGNLSSNIVFMGIKPGSYQLKKLSNENIVSECSWLLGPSSQVLNRALYKCSIYPYFTNAYHFHEHELDCSVSLCIKELKVLFSIHKKLKIFFMGNYQEFVKISQILRREEYDFDEYKIWRPSYILRLGCTNFDVWVNKIKECLL